jgi:hypothetical protein
MLIAKLNSSLVVERSKCYGGTRTEECNSIVQLTDGSYVALGYTSTHNNGDVTGHHGSQGSDDFWLLKLTSTGAITWAKCFGGSGDDQANGLTKSSDGGLVMCGLTNSMDGDVTGFHVGDYSPDVWVVKVNASGAIQWQRSCGGNTQDESFNVAEISSGVFVVTAFSYSNDGDVSGNHGNADGWIFRISGGTSIASNEDPNISVFPNPFTNSISVNVTSNSIINVFNIQGQLVYNQTIVNQNNIIDLSELTAGFYTVVIKTDTQTLIKKLTKVQF